VSPPKDQPESDAVVVPRQTGDSNHAVVQAAWSPDAGRLPATASNADQFLTDLQLTDDRFGGRGRHPFRMTAASGDDVLPRPGQPTLEEKPPVGRPGFDPNIRDPYQDKDISFEDLLSGRVHDVAQTSATTPDTGDTSGSGSAESRVRHSEITDNPAVAKERQHLRDLARGSIKDPQELQKFYDDMDKLEQRAARDHLSADEIAKT
jgi:hypothetical protein